MPVEDTGRNSVIPSTIPIIIAFNISSIDLTPHSLFYLIPLYYTIFYDLYKYINKHIRK